MTRTRRATAPATADDIAGMAGFTDAVCVASGATSQVLRVRQPAMDRRVAVKLFSQAGHSSWARALCEHEVAVTGRLSSHPSVVTIFEHGVSSSGLPFIVMPWFERGSLADEIARQGPLSVPETMRIGARIASGLDHAHRNDVLHRDVKPANVLLSELGQAVLADFGGALWLGRSPILEAAHTPAHSAPEVLHGQAATPQSDTWSLASTLFTALIGHPPFTRDNPRPGLGDLRQLATDPAAALSRPDIPPELAALIMTGLAQDPAARPAAMQMARQLQQIESSLGLSITEIPALTGPADVAAHAMPGEATVHRPAPADPKDTWGRKRLLAISGVLAGSAAAALVAVLGVRAAHYPDSTAPSPAVPSVQAAMAPVLLKQPPIAAQGLQADLVGRTTVALHWSDPNAGKFGYRVLISPAPGGEGEHAADTATNDTVSGLRPATAYAFRIQTGSGSVVPVTAPVKLRTLP